MGRWQSFKNMVWGKKESRTAGIITTPASGGVIWTPKGYDNFAKETYLKNATAFASIVEIATNVASVPWAQYRRIEDNKREIVTDTAVAQILKRANPQESFQAVMLAATAYLVMSGNTFFERVTPDSGPNKDDIKELYAKRPDRFKLKVNPATGQLEKYIYSVDGRSVDWEVDPITGQADILHLKSFHPLDDWWGAAPTESAAREIDTSNAATQWNMSLLQNQGRPGMVYTLIGALGEQQFDELEKRLAAKTGVTEVGKNMILTGERGTKAEPFGWSPTDMDFSEGDLRLMRKIAMAYRVPPMLLGIPGEATFANFKEARLAFWESTIFYYLNYKRGELNNWFFERDSDMFVDYILDDIPALAIKRDAIWKRAQESDFLTIDQKLEMVGLPKYKPSEDPGSMIFIEASKIPIGVAIEEKEIEDEEETVKMLQDEGYSEEEIDEMLGYKYSEKQKYKCECISCGHKIESDKHCIDITCPKCGDKMRRQGRPGQGKDDLPDEGKPFPNEH